jgi:hypothetical protein
MPAAARGTDAAAAKAFVKFYWDTVNYAQVTGDVDELQGLSDACTGCDAGIRFIRDVYDQHGVISGGRGRLVDLETGFVGRGHSRAVVTCEVISTEQQIDLPGTSGDETYAGGRQPFQFMLEPRGLSWAIVFMGAP